MCVVGHELESERLKGRVIGSSGIEASQETDVRDRRLISKHSADLKPKYDNSAHSSRHR